MAAFPAAVQAQIESKLVRAAPLVQFEFLTAIKRVWTGFGPVVSGGYTWDGLNDLGAVSGLSQGRDGAAEQATFTVSGVSAQLLATALGEEGEYIERPVKVFLQFFGEDWQPLDDPYAIWAGLMDKMTISRSAGDTPVRTITLTAENIFATRARPPYGSYTDRDQQARFPGDKFCERVPDLQNKVKAWPKT